MPSSEISPSVEQLQHIVTFLKGLPPEILRRGSSLSRTGAVQRLWWSANRRILGSKVLGGHLYSQAIRFQPTGLRNRDAGCSCPYGGACKHVAAALITYSKGWQGPGQDERGEDDDYDPDLDDDDDDNENDEDQYSDDDARDDNDGGDDDAREDAGSSSGPQNKTSKNKKPAASPASSASSRRLPPPSPATAKSPPPTPTQPQPAAKTAAKTTKPWRDLSILANVLADRFDLKLTAAEKRGTAIIDKLFQENTPQISTDTLLTITGQPKSYRYYYDPPVILWPSRRPPATIIEAWYYAAHALKNHPSVRKDCVLLKNAPWPEVERLIAPWKRMEAIEQWRTRLSSFNTAPEAPPSVSPVFRLLLDAGGAQIQVRSARGPGWENIKATALRAHGKEAWIPYAGTQSPPLDENAIRFLHAACPRDPYGSKPYLEKTGTQFITALNTLLRSSSGAGAVAGPGGQPVTLSPVPAAWSLEGPHFPAFDSPVPDSEAELAGDYTLAIRLADGSPIPEILALLPGRPNLALTSLAAYPLPGPPLPGTLITHGATIPVAAIESPAGLTTLERLRIPLPNRVTRRVRTVALTVTVRCRLNRDWNVDVFQLRGTSASGGLFPDETWQSGTWKPDAPHISGKTPTPAPAAPASDTLTRLDRSLQSAATEWLLLAGLTVTVRSTDGYWMERRLPRQTAVTFPDEFLHWLDQRPEGVTVELDPELAALRDHGKVTGSFSLDLEESGIDWFDLTLNLKLSDVELTPKEINLLLRHTGSWVRLPDRGWRRLDFELTPEHQQQLADLGLSPNELNSSEKQRLHTLQLAHPSAAGLLPAERVAQVQRRAADLRTAVAPGLPAGITATLRPYQMAGYHFLAYLSTNRFGGILADDMGLGKTLQALTWLAWLHETGQTGGQPTLVVCPKSVQDNWTSEASKFYPALPVRQWTPANTGDLTGIPPAGKTAASAKAKAKTKTSSRQTKTKTGSPPAAETASDAAVSPPLLIVINYTQLRLHAGALTAISWSAVILDEAQYIKNPASQTARTAFSLKAGHRLALSGTPIENRLLDLWSIMAFSMPGILGNRALFAKNFGAKEDPLARRRLSARVRPFVLRRTKKEVAADLPDRIEEDLFCTLEGPQQEQYTAELKLARSTLLKAKTSAQLDKLRFNILTSLLRLRQICCHPRLTKKGKPDAESAKLNALLELLEPLVEEGHKVLIFSQFVEMLHLIGDCLTAREWPHLLLTGATEDRGALVREFQESEGANLFLISLKAGGSGLNLTAASYVVLFDPWWNPAVENQAIDRTHRIGQVNKVIAYRLITRDTIEEKIRHLQKSKSALAADILGEETFAKALTLDDFQFLLNP
ncbi:MAG: DEAD/DEAH box helicase [Verrucomicrobiota bacterium]